MLSADLIFAASPIALLIFLMTKKRSLPSNFALPLAAAALYAILLGYFGARPVLVHAAVAEGLLTALTPILIVWGAILLFQTMEHSGAIMPWTTVSPSPQAASRSTAPGKPLSVSMENITPAPARSERTISCTPTDSATCMCSKPWFLR